MPPSWELPACWEIDNAVRGQYARMRRQYALKGAQMRVKESVIVIAYSCILTAGCTHTQYTIHIHPDTILFLVEPKLKPKQGRILVLFYLCLYL